MIAPTDNLHASQRIAKPRGPITRLLDLFSSIWFGVTLLSLLFVYCSIGSAIPAVRQLPALEMTEFEWFHWWPFDVLVGLFCLAMITVTLRRIPLRLVNAGVWTIHTGVITLALGSYIYFGTKIEGDTLVFRRQVVVELPGLTHPASLVALPGSSTHVSADSGVWRFAVQSTNSDWPILSEPDKGKHAHAVNVSVTPPDGEPFIRQLLSGFPQYTEDVIPGKGRAIKAIGRKLVREELKLSLDYEPATAFHVMDTWALFVRRVGDREWVERPIEGLPRYHDRINARDQVFHDRGNPLALRPLDIAVPPGPTPDALGDTPVHITGYLRYAHMETKWIEGESRLNPVLNVTASQTKNGASSASELVALDPRRNKDEQKFIEFRWFDDPSWIAALPQRFGAFLNVSVPDKDVHFEIPITRTTLVGNDGPFTPIEGTDFAYRVRWVQDDLALPGTQGTVSVAMVGIKTPEGVFNRMVADDPAKTKDMHGGGGDPHSPEARTTGEPDPRIVITYQPWTSPVIFVAHPGGLHLVVNEQDKRLISRDVAVGDVVPILEGHVTLRVNNLLLHAKQVLKPRIVPPSRRQRSAKTTFSKIQLEINDGLTVDRQWLSFNLYAFPDVQYAQRGRFSFMPEQFRLADGTRIEVLFSRQRQDLPGPIALDDFELDTHYGGYGGRADTIRNYVSRLRFFDDGAWTPPTQIAVNHPTGFGGLWYFQSTWDPPSAGPGTGMNYTGLGVGNRNGVYVQLAGSIIATIGMIFAFYIKPVLKRRRAERSRAKIGNTTAREDDESSAQRSIQEPVGAQTE